MTEKITSEEYVKQHPITRKLKSLGVSNKQLHALRFWKHQDGSPFSLWPYTGFVGKPKPSIALLLKPYCALKWLILENPPHSRDKEDAWRLVNDTVAAPLFELGLKHKESQRGRARNERGKVNEEGETINQLIGRMCLEPRYKDKSAGQLWSDFIVRLSDALLDPKEIQHPTDVRKLSVEYNFKGDRKVIGLGQFSNVVSDYRRGKKIIPARLT